MKLLAFSENSDWNFKLPIINRIENITQKFDSTHNKSNDELAIVNAIEQSNENEEKHQANEACVSGADEKVRSCLIMCKATLSMCVCVCVSAIQILQYSLLYRICAVALVLAQLL